MASMSIRMLATGTMIFGALGALGVAGCAAPASAETSGSSSQKLLAPRAIVRTGASPKTRSTLGIYEWRVHKGTSDFILTGYDENKKPVQGFSLTFAGKQADQKPRVLVRVLDGKGFSGSYDFSRASLKGSLTAKGRQFLIRAAADFTTVATYAPVTGGVSRASAGIHILGEAAPAGCARNAGKFIAGGVGCAVGAATAETGAGAVLAGSACYLAADSAIDFLSSCYGGSAGAADPSAANTFCDPGGSGFCSTPDPGASSSSGDTGASSGSGSTTPETNDKAGDPAGNGQSEDPGVLTSANNDSGTEAPAPEQASESVQTASNESSCDSCQGGAGDLDVNASNGDVQLADNQSSGGSDTGASDTGGSDTGGSDTGGGDVETAAFHRSFGINGGR